MSVAMFLVGMAVPLPVVVAFRDLLALYLTGTEFTVVAAATFALVAWVLLEEWRLDRPNFLVAAVVGPGLFFLATLLYGMAVGGFDALRYLFDGVGIFGFLAAFGAAGFGAVGLSGQVRTLARHAERVPPARTVAAGSGVLAVAVLAVVFGANLAAAGSVSVTATEPGIERVQDPALNVTVAGGPAEVRVTAVAPDGTSVTKRLTRAETGHGTATVSVPVWYGDPPSGHLPVRSGTYRVRVTALSGVTVDAASFDTERGRGVVVTDARAGSDVTREDPPERTVRADGRGTTAGGTPVDVVVENGEPFHANVGVWLSAGGERLTTVGARDVFVEPGGRVGVVLDVPPDTAERIRTDHDGVVSVTVFQDRFGSTRPVANATVRLPEK